MAAPPIELQAAAIKKYDREPTGIIMSPDRKYLCTYRSAEITLWEVRKPETAATVFKIPGGVVQDLAFSPDGRLLAAATDDSQAILWSFPEGERIAVLEDKLNKPGFFKNLLDYSSHNQVVFSPDGRFLASFNNTSRPLIWDLASLSLHKQLEEPAADTQNSRMDFSPDSQMILVGHSHKVALYHVETGIVIKNFKAVPQSLVFHSQRKQFAVGVRNRVVLFDPSQPGAELHTQEKDKINTITKIMFHRNGRHILAVGRSIGSKVSKDILYAWSLARGGAAPDRVFDSSSLDLYTGVKNPLYRIHFPSPEHIALVVKNAPQIIILLVGAKTIT